MEHSIFGNVPLLVGARVFPVSGAHHSVGQQPAKHRVSSGTCIAVTS